MTRTTCPYCGVGCGVIASPAGVQGDPDHPANAGRLCSKGAALGETLGLDNRLLYPEIGGKRVGWDVAIDRVAAGLAATIARHGPDSVALYVSGQLLTEDYYAANKLAKGFLGTPNIDSNSRLCMASAVSAHRRAFGEDLVPGVYEDLELADVVVLVGSNTAWCHPVLFQRIVAARALRPEMRIVVIDPRRTATCEAADLHLKLRPGSDVALFNGLLRHLHAGGLAVPGARDAAAALAACGDRDATAAVCGLDQAELAAFFALFAGTERVVTLFSQGVNQSSAGTDKANAIINVHLLTGRIGRPGMGPFSITGQPNAMGGREVGALANALAGHLDWTRPGEWDALRAHWNAPALVKGPGLKAVALFDAIEAGHVRAVWIVGTNPAISLPDGARMRRAMAECELVVVQDCVATQDMADLAHVRLPALAWGEKNGTVTNSERVISRQRTFLPPPGEARADWRIFADVAARMGFADAFAWTGPAAIFREHAGLTGLGKAGARAFDITGLAGLSDAEYAALPPTRWPVPASGQGPARLLGEGAGAERARMVAVQSRPPVNLPDAAWPLVLITGRLRDQWHTMTRTGKTPRLFAHVPEPVLSVHPDDASALIEGGLVIVESAWGRAVLRARVDPGLRPGTVFAPMHWTSEFCPAARINAVVNPAVDPVSGQPELKHTPVRVRPFAAAWYGFALTRGRLEPGCDWFASLRAGAEAWRHELAGAESPALARARLLALLHGPGAWLTLEDPAEGVFRAARVLDGRLQAVLFMAPAPLATPRDWLAGLFAAPALAPDERRALLSGQPASGTAPEPAVCVCHGVGAAAIRGCGGRSVEAVGRATRAGTNCGSCRPEIAALLAALPALEPA